MPPGMVFFYAIQKIPRSLKLRGKLYGKLQALDELVDGGSALLACAHGQDDGGSAGNGIAAGEDALTGGHLVLVDDQTARAVGLQAGSGGADQGVGACAQGHDDGALT